MASIVMKSPIRYANKSRMSSHEKFSMIDAATVQTTEPESESPFERSLRKGSLSDIDQEILALIHSVPQKTSNTYTDIFCLYQKALRIYQAVSIKKLPCDVGIHLPDRSARRKVYQLVFDALYRKLDVINKESETISLIFFSFSPDHEVLQDLLVESSFYSRNFDVKFTPIFQNALLL